MQRRLRRISVLLAGIVMLCGCQNGKGSPNRKEILPPSFSASVSVQQEKLNCTAELHYSAETGIQLQFTAPKALQKLQITRCGAETRLAFSELEVKAPSSFLPQSAFVQCLYDALSALSEENRCICQHGKNSDLYIGKTANEQPFTWTVSAKDGALECLDMEKEHLKIIFSDFRASK